MTNARAWAVVAALACACPWAPAPARAAEKTAQAAEKTAATAKAAYEKGDFENAARLFYQAWQVQPNQGGWLYSSARACHKAGLYDDAAQRYEAFLANPKGAEDKLTQARGHLDDVQRERVKALLRRAQEAPDPALGYRHAAAAARILPDDLRVWVVAAELADKGGMAAEAVAAYREVLRLSTADSAEARAALRRLAALGASNADAEAQKQQREREKALEAERQRAEEASRAEAAAREKAEQDRLAAQAAQAERAAREKADRDRRDKQAAEGDRPADSERGVKEPPPRKVVQYDLSGAEGPGFAWGPLATVLGGAALAGMGSYWLAGAATDEAELRRQTWGVVEADPKAYIAMGYLDAQTKARSIGERKAVGWSLAGTGGAAVVAGGLWWLLRDSGPRPAVVWVAPAASGASIVLGGHW
ncbi:MAG: tetratricopeptide repeat protein [Deltaproteobacteria bacterium]|nr:tetratricopeptide repeat protein [Deltaproteobacteria bacterium]